MQASSGALSLPSIPFFQGGWFAAIPCGRICFYWYHNRKIPISYAGLKLSIWLESKLGNLSALATMLRMFPRMQDRKLVSSLDLCLLYSSPYRKADAKKERRRFSGPLLFVVFFCFPHPFCFSFCKKAAHFHWFWLLSRQKHSFSKYCLLRASMASFHFSGP